MLTWMYRPTSGVDGEWILNWILDSCFPGTRRDSHIRKLSYHSMIHIIDLHANLWHKTLDIQFQAVYYSESKSHPLVMRIGASETIVTI